MELLFRKIEKWENYNQIQLEILFKRFLVLSKEILSLLQLILFAFWFVVKIFIQFLAGQKMYIQLGPNGERQEVEKASWLIK